MPTLLTLPLLVLRISAQNPHDTLATHNLAPITHLLYTGANLHPIAVPSYSVMPAELD